VTREAAARFVISSCCCSFRGSGFGVVGCRITRGGASELEGILVSWGFVSFTKVAGFAPSSSQELDLFAISWSRTRSGRRRVLMLPPAGNPRGVLPHSST
jgi:hypothetical protein